MQPTVRAWITLTTWLAAATDRAGDQSRQRDRGEGIVSVAIAVLIMAALGVVAYGAFDVLFNNTTDAAEQQISGIGG